MHLTLATVLVARALLDQPSDAQWGTDICARAGLPGGTTYPILRRMFGEGWLADEWQADPPPGRNPRRYYHVTNAGLVGLTALLSRARADARFGQLFAAKPPPPTFTRGDREAGA